MKTLKIDDKFSIIYDETDNDRPFYLERYGSRHLNFTTSTPNWIIAMFYALLEHHENNLLVSESKENCDRAPSRHHMLPVYDTTISGRLTHHKLTNMSSITGRFNRTESSQNCFESESLLEADLATIEKRIMYYTRGYSKQAAQDAVVFGLGATLATIDEAISIPIWDYELSLKLKTSDAAKTWGDKRTFVSGPETPPSKSKRAKLRAKRKKRTK